MTAADDAPEITTFCAALEAGDADAIGRLVTADAVVHSPLTGLARFEGRDEVTALHRDLFAVLRAVRTREPLTRDGEWSVSFEALVGRVELEAVVVARSAGDGRLAELTYFVRPLSATAALFAALPSRIVARRRGRIAAVVVAVVARCIGVAVRAGERLL